MHIDYDDNNYPSRIQFANGNVTEYVYSATGEKLRAVHYTAVPNIEVGSGETHELTQAEILFKDSTDYHGSLIMENGVPSQYLFDGGYCKLKDNSGNPAISYHYFDRDHLGNIRGVIDESGTVEQITNYYPFGAPYSDATTTNPTFQRYKYNGKELELMHGLKWYDYGARWYDPLLANWNRPDPSHKDYYPWSPYAYCGDNPVNAVDPDGRKIVFINGYLGFGSPEGGKSYWNGFNSTFVKGAQSFFNDNNVFFTDTDHFIFSSARSRIRLGYEYARNHYNEWISDMSDDESFKLVSHSMGGAFSKGIETYLKEKGRKVDFNVMINTYQVDKIRNDKDSQTFYIDYQNTNDPVLFLFDSNLGYGSLENSNIIIRESSDDELFNIHKSPIDNGTFWNNIKQYINNYLSK